MWGMSIVSTLVRIVILEKDGTFNSPQARLGDRNYFKSNFSRVIKTEIKARFKAIWDHHRSHSFHMAPISFLCDPGLLIYLLFYPFFPADRRAHPTLHSLDGSIPSCTVRTRPPPLPPKVCTQIFTFLDESDNSKHLFFFFFG